MRTPFRTTALLALSGLAIAAGCGDDDGTDPQTGGESGDCLGGEEHPNVEADGETCIVSGTIESDLTLTADKTWLLQGGVFVGAYKKDCDDMVEDVADQDVTLTIEAGTTVYGDTSQDTFLSISRGAMIMAEGTADAPIVFTSSKEAGSRGAGDWGGLVINGRAKTNKPAPVVSEGGAGCYGGTDDKDNSGVLEYVRVEFGGKTFTSEDELNGIAFQAVGSATTVDYIQSHLNQDDGIEFFGGTVQVNHAVVTGSGDDQFDWTFGWRGGAENVVLHQFPNIGDRGIEADNNEDNNSAQPMSSPILKNFTIVAPDADNHGITLRRGTEAEIDNFLVVGWEKDCLQVDNLQTVENLEAGNPIVTNSIFDCAKSVTQVAVCNSDSDDPSDEDEMGNEITPCPDSGVDEARSMAAIDMFDDPENQNSTDGAGVESDSPTNPNYAGTGAGEGKGAIASTDWTEGWTAYPAD